MVIDFIELLGYKPERGKFKQSLVDSLSRDKI